MQRIRLKQFALVAVVTVLVIVGILIYQSLIFNVASISPDLSKDVPTSSSSLVVTFNKNLSQDFSLKQVTDPSMFASSSISGRTLTLRFKNLVAKQYTSSIKDIKSENGRTIHTIDISFQARYIAFGDLPKELQEQQIKDTDTHSIASFLPYETNDYRISYDTNNSSEHPLIYIDMKFNSSEATPSNDYLNSVRKYRKEALAYLKSQGVSESTSTFQYSEPYLLNEFPLGYQAPNPE